MTTKALKALFWKEYRQHFALWLAMIIMCVLFQIAMYIWFYRVMGSLREIVDFDYMLKCSLAFIIIYAIACSAILFAKEKEDKTDNFLRNMPITGNVVLVGKLLWLFVSMAVLSVIMLIVTFAWLMILGPPQWTTSEFWNGLGFFCIYCFSGTSLGLFWSSITRKQLYAIVGALASMFLLFVLAVLITDWFTSPEEGLFDVLIISLYLGFCVALGGIGIRNGGKWLRKREDKTLGAKIDALQNKQWRRKNITIEQLRAQKQPHGEFRWLMWQCYRQSSLMFKMGLGLAVILLLWPMLASCIATENLRDGFSAFFVMVFWVCGYILCCNIFYPDHGKNGIMVLSYRGISPGKVWWSRIAMFGGLFVVCIAALICSSYINEQLGKPIPLDSDTVAFNVCFFLSAFIVGQFASVISRSLVLPMCYTVVFLFFGYLWAIYVMLINDMGIALESLAYGTVWFSSHFWLIVLIFLPVVLSFFVASRLRIADWMRDRPLRASWRKLALAFGGGLILSTALLATVRMTTVPTASLGYKLDPWVLQQNVDHDANYKRYAELQASLEGNTNFADYINVRRELKAIQENPKQAVGFVFLTDDMIYGNIINQIANPDVTPEFLREAIAFLETSHESRIPATTLVQRYYEWVMQNIRTGELPFDYNEFSQIDQTLYFCRKHALWEKSRALRFAEYRFQTDSLLAEQSERLIYNNEGNIDYLREKIGLLKITTPNHNLYCYDFDIPPVTPFSIYVQEQGRRVALLQAALRLWYDEHGELPETLDQLQGVYLTEVPLVPYYNKPFEYNPKPDETNDAASFVDFPGGRRLPTDHAKGTPYLATTLDIRFPTDHVIVGKNQFVFDLKFAK